MEKRISGTTTLLGLIGTPVGHSGSPAMYNYCFQKLGFDYAYMAFDIREDQLGHMMKCADLLNMRGMNVTMPLKQAIVSYMDKLTPAAKLIGACNTVVKEDETWIGHNTDGIGFVHNLRDNGVEICGKRLTLLGAGGAATAVAVQCALDGAKEISIFNIKDTFFERAQVTARNIEEAVSGCKIHVYDLQDGDKLAEEIGKSDILANATRVGMAPRLEAMPIPDLSVLRAELIVTDVIYNPKETRFLEEAKKIGCKTVGGTGMLVWQGAEAFHIYTGAEMPVEEVKALFFR